MESRKDIQHLRVSLDGKLLIMVDVEGYSVGYDLEKDKPLSHFRFK